jgi:hypothetical protein
MVKERPVRVERKLSAILATDVAGYSRLMHHDEEATHANLTNPARSIAGIRPCAGSQMGFLTADYSAISSLTNQ